MASRRRQGRIVGGTDAPRWAAPWQVAVRQRQPPGSLVCGGVLIEHRSVPDSDSSSCGLELQICEKW